MQDNLSGQLIAHAAAQYYLEQSNTYSVVDVREKFEGTIRIVGGKPYLVFKDDSTLSVQKIVRAKFRPKPKEKYERTDDTEMFR